MRHNTVGIHVQILHEFIHFHSSFENLENSFAGNNFSSQMSTAAFYTEEYVFYGGVKTIYVKKTTLLVPFVHLKR